MNERPDHPAGRADASEAKKLHALIQANLEEGHLLPRTLHELTMHAARFVVAVRGRKIVGCAELARAQHARRRGALARRRRQRARRPRRCDDRRRAAPARAPRGLREAVRVHPRAAATSFTSGFRSCRTCG